MVGKVNKRVVVSIRGALLGVFVLFAGSYFFASELLAQQSHSPRWVTAYYMGSSQGWYDNGLLPSGLIDYSAITHIIHFALLPNPDGSLDTNDGMHQSNSAPLISKAHGAGAKVLISVGGAASNALFRQATDPAVIGTFINNLVGFMQSRGYDGIDIDWETVDPPDSLKLSLFLTSLRQRLDALTPRPLLTAAAGLGAATLWKPVAGLLDQINLMTYDFSNARPGWVTWHNSPLYSRGADFPGTGVELPSADTLAGSFISAGIPPEKLAIGIDFYGYNWSGGGGTTTGGVTKPRQSWTTPPSVQANVHFSTIMSGYFSPGLYRWDTAASAPYLSIDLPDSANDKFISYDDERSCQAKVDYVRNKGLGGVFIWELGGGVLPPGYYPRDPLLQAVKRAVHGPPSDSLPPVTLPRAFNLLQNYPNPFNPVTVIRYTLPVRSPVSLAVYNSIGQLVATLVNETEPAGFRSVTFDGGGLPSGAYFYRLDAGGFTGVMKMMVIR